MCVLIILGWILSVMATPTIIWVVYGVFAISWVVNVLLKLAELASGK